MQYEITLSSELTDEELIRLTQTSDESAFTELMHRYTSRIWKLIIANSRELSDADEILMDVWRSVWENIDRLHNYQSFGAWIRTIAYNACKRYYSSRKYPNHLIVFSDVILLDRMNQDSITYYNRTELLLEVTEAVHHLPEKLLRIAELYYLEMWSITEIHMELGLAIGTIKTRLRQARELLRKEFGVQPNIRGNFMRKQDESKQYQTNIKVIGVGNAGSNAVQRIVEIGMTGIESYVVNTDQQALEKCNNGIQIQIGKNTTQGLGSGANPEIGKMAAEENIEKIKRIVEKAEIVFIIAGMGGGTGTGVAPIIASHAQKQGAITVGVVTSPFKFESERYHQRAHQGIEKLSNNTDSIVVIQNQSLLNAVDRPLNIREAFSISDKAILHGVECLSGLYSDIMQ